VGIYLNQTAIAKRFVIFAKFPYAQLAEKDLTTKYAAKTENKTHIALINAISKQDGERKTRSQVNALLVARNMSPI